jgi:hypothetical protein
MTIKDILLANTPLLLDLLIGDLPDNYRPHWPLPSWPEYEPMTVTPMVTYSNDGVIAIVVATFPPQRGAGQLIPAAVLSYQNNLISVGSIGPVSADAVNAIRVTMNLVVYPWET